MSIYGHALFWSAIACVLAALVVCTLVLRYGFTRDVDPAGRWGWRPTRAGHGVAAALFGTGIALAILALTAVPLGGKERPLGERLRSQLETLRGRVGAFESAVARLAEEGLRRILPAERRQARAGSTGSSARADAANAAPHTTASHGSTIGGGGHAVVDAPPVPAAPPPAPSTERRPERRTVRTEPRPVEVAPAARPAPVE